MVRATVREWQDALGWGVLDSAETPGGCWTHYSAVVTPILTEAAGVRIAELRRLSPGDEVDLEWETPGQDGYHYRATSVRRG